MLLAIWSLGGNEPKTDQYLHTQFQHVCTTTESRNWEKLKMEERLGETEDKNSENKKEGEKKKPSRQKKTDGKSEAHLYKRFTSKVTTRKVTARLSVLPLCMRLFLNLYINSLASVSFFKGCNVLPSLSLSCSHKRESHQTSLQE